MSCSLFLTDLPADELDDKQLPGEFSYSIYGGFHKWGIPKTVGLYHVYIYIYKRLYIQLFSTTPVPKKVQRQLSLLNVAGNWDGTMHSGTL